MAFGNDTFSRLFQGLSFLTSSSAYRLHHYLCGVHYYTVKYLPYIAGLDCARDVETAMSDRFKELSACAVVQMHICDCAQDRAWSRLN